MLRHKYKQHMKLKNLTSLFSFVLFAALVSSCNKEDKCGGQAATQSSIQGKWTHRYPTNLQPDFTQPDLYERVQFKADSFFLEVQHNTDVVIVGCQNKEYMKGTFKISNAKMLLTGVYTEADYSIKTSPCNNTGAYNKSFDISFCNQDLILYLSANANAPEHYKRIELYRQ